ncbi:hypothetical protein ACP4OV_031614 [Aristida adscensionis]
MASGYICTQACAPCTTLARSQLARASVGRRSPEHQELTMPMAAAPAATLAPGGASCPSSPPSRSRGSFLVPSPNAAGTATATAVRLARRGGGARGVVLGVLAPRSGRRDGCGGGGGDGLVDEDMATLRRRIREARAALAAAGEDGIDRDDADAGAGAALQLPAGWTELERRHHGSYVAVVRAAAGLLEACLVRARPGLGAAAVALLLLSLPATLLLVCAQLISAVDSLSSAGLNGR